MLVFEGKITLPVVQRPKQKSGASTYSRTIQDLNNYDDDEEDDNVYLYHDDENNHENDETNDGTSLSCFREEHHRDEMTLARLTQEAKDIRNTLRLKMGHLDAG